MNMINGFVRYGVMSLSLMFLVGCGSPATQDNKSADTASGKIQVVAAEDFWGEVAQAVGGQDVTVTSILNNPTVDPHDYEPTPDASKAVSDAKLVIYTGIGYDEWTSKLIQASASANQKTVIRVGTDVLHKQTGDNPHVWYIPSALPSLANDIADQLSKMDPAHAKEYHQRATAYIQKLQPLNRMISHLKQTSSVNIDVSEPVFDYMATALHMNVCDSGLAKAVEDGNDPSPSELADVQNDIKTKKIKFFVENIQNETPTVANIVKLARSNNIPVVQVTETKPTGKDYLTWMMDQLQQVQKALNNNAQ